MVLVEEKGLACFHSGVVAASQLWSAVLTGAAVLGLALTELCFDLWAGSSCDKGSAPLS